MEKDIGETLAVMEHRIGKLEEWPPRVEAVEKELEAIKTEGHLTRKIAEETRKEGHHTNTLVRNLEISINRLFWTGAGVFGTCSVIWTVGAVVWKAIKNGLFA